MTSQRGPRWAVHFQIRPHTCIATVSKELRGILEHASKFWKRWSYGISKPFNIDSEA
jgi:hypothetical protein